MKYIAMFAAIWGIFTPFRVLITKSKIIKAEVLVNLLIHIAGFIACLYFSPLTFALFGTVAFAEVLILTTNKIDTPFYVFLLVVTGLIVLFQATKGM